MQHQVLQGLCRPTVDGRNPTPPGMVGSLYIMASSSSLVVQDFVHVFPVELLG